MDQQLQATTDRKYIDFEPETTTIQAEDCETVLVHVPGFQKEQLKVKLNPNGSYGTLSVTGEREVENNKWSRAHKEYRLSENCDTQKIAAKFEADKLCITLPKLKKTPSDVPPSHKKGQPDTNPDNPSGHVTTPMPSTDQSKERNDKADYNELRKTQREGKKKTEKPISRVEPKKAGPSTLGITTSMPGTTDQPQQRSNEADKYASGETQQDEKKTGKQRVEHERPEPWTSRSLFLVALLVLVLGFFASTWFASSGK